MTRCHVFDVLRIHVVPIIFLDLKRQSYVFFVFAYQKKSHASRVFDVIQIHVISHLHFLDLEGQISRQSCLFFVFSQKKSHASHALDVLQIHVISHIFF